MNKPQLIDILTRKGPGTYDIGPKWSSEQVLAMWEEHASRRARLNFHLSVWDDGRTVVISPRQTGTTGREDALFHIVVWALVLFICLLGIHLLAPTPPARYDEPAPTCWEWERDGHTIAITNTLAQFELAHETYRRTGKAPDSLTECTK